MTAKLGRSRTGDPSERHSATRAPVQPSKTSIFNRLDKTGATEALSNGFGPAPARLKILIGTPKRLEIAVNRTKQNAEVISNRNKNATLAIDDLAGAHARIENLAHNLDAAPRNPRGRPNLTKEHFNAGR
ncbi:MAG: hypothetical protein WA755_06735 [Candidatus Acidiferrales bacterium]